VRYLSAVSFSVLLVAACTGGGSSSAGGSGTPDAGEGGADSSSAGSGSGGASGKVGAGASGDAAAGENPGTAGMTGSDAGTAGSAGTLSTGSILYVPPAQIVGGACQGTPEPPSPPCTFAPEQVYCKKSDPGRVIMAVCSAAGRTQCEVIDECEPGWHACTATDYVARGGRDVAPAFSSNTDRAWLAACVRDVDGNKLKNEACSVCGQDPAYPPSIEWWCDGTVVYEGGMDGDTLGVVAAPECMRVGANSAGNGAFWSMSFSEGAPSFVMCCSDAL